MPKILAHTRISYFISSSFLFFFFSCFPLQSQKIDSMPSSVSPWGLSRVKVLWYKKPYYFTLFNFGNLIWKSALWYCNYRQREKKTICKCYLHCTSEDFEELLFIPSFCLSVEITLKQNQALSLFLFRGKEEFVAPATKAPWNWDT